VLRAVDFTVEDGTLTGLIGPNGAGKTTLLGALTGLARVESGQVVLGGEDATSWSTAARCRWGLARTFQVPQLIEELTAAQHIILAERMYASRREEEGTHDPAGRVRRQRRRRTDDDGLFGRTIDLLHLEPYLNHYPSMLPLGVQRIVEVAQCLVMSPRVLLLDEPFAGLGTEDRRVLEAALLRIREDLHLAVVLVEHDLELVLRNCDIIQVLDYGLTLFVGTPTEVGESSEVRRAYIGV
jgi:branched-chain amino acid transport system ATP-binding protein